MTADQLFVLLVAWATVGLATLVVWRLIASPWGRVVRAIREDEDAARALGKPVFLYKMQCLGLGGLLSTIAGVLLAVHQQHVDPEAYLPVVTFYAYTALILGGAGTTVGPIAGSVCFWLLLALTDSIIGRTASDTLALSAQQLATVRFMLVGLFLVLLVRYRPAGVFGRSSST
jgi:neutral amino acid transport system permease protein